MRKTDYLIGIHGAGLCLSIFMPYESIVQEVNPRKYISVVTLMSALSWHVTYSDLTLLRSKTNIIDGNENIFFEPKFFVKSVLNRMLENNFL